MSGGDFDGAEREYRQVLDTVGNRSLESLYLRDVLARARRGVQEAQSRKKAGIAAATQAVAATEPAGGPDLNRAIKSFQRASEAFADFVRARPVLFRDIHGSWRRRQFVVWEVNYEVQSDADPARIVLQYMCTARLTEPHADRADALGDQQFRMMNLPRPLAAKRHSCCATDGGS